MSTQTEEWGQEDGKEELYRIGIPADLHTPQLEPGPIGIQLCGPVYKGCVSPTSRFRDTSLRDPHLKFGLGLQ